MLVVELNGFFSVKVPVRDLDRSRAWYERTMGYRVEIEFPDDHGLVTGVAGHLVGAGDTYFALRTDPSLADALHGMNLFNLAVSDDDDLDRWVLHLDGLSVDHSPKIDATVGWMIVVHDADGYEIHLYSRQRHGLDQRERSGYGRTSPNDQFREEPHNRTADT